MPCDGLFIHFLTSELSENLTGGKVNKIMETGKLEIIFEIRIKNKEGKIGNKNLLISTSLEMPRLYLTMKKPGATVSPRNFCMVLRKHLERSIITSITQHQNDRLIIFTFSNSNELGDQQVYHLMVELMGRNSNMILTNSQYLIIDAIRKLPPSDEVTRIILPKASYVFPTSIGMVNPFSSDVFMTDLTNLEGVASIVRQNILHYNGGLKAYLANVPKPYIYENNHKIDFYLLPLDDLSDKKILENDFNSLSEMLETYYNKYKTIDTDQTKELKKLLKNKIIHLQTKVDNLEKDLRSAEDNLIYQHYGLLLQTNLYQVKKGMDKISVADFTNNFEMVEIPLNPMLDPGINLKKIFSKAKKAKNGIIMINEQLSLTKDEIAYLDNILQQLDFASPSDIDEIKTELINNKYLKPSKQTKPKNKTTHLTIFTFDDHEVYVGKNNLQNDYITHKIAKGYDWWFHVKDMPGSHVVFKVKQPLEVLTEEIIRYCANLAASFSRASHSSSVAVDYVQVRFLKKIPAVKGYKVTYTNQKTIYIDPKF